MASRKEKKNASGRSPWLWVALVLSVATAVGGWVWWQDRQGEQRAEEEAREAEREADREARDERRTEALGRLQEESGALMPAPLEGIELGMPLGAVRERRPNLQVRLEGGAGPERTWMEERLPNGSQVVYAFEKGEDRLVQIQIMSVLPSADALSAHLQSMIETYGSPTGAWDCPNTGGVPTRRFTWRRSKTALADVLLVYGNRISQTLYIAPVETIGASLRRGGCSAMDREDLENWPVATVDQIKGAAEARP